MIKLSTILKSLVMLSASISFVACNTEVNESLRTRSDGSIVTDESSMDAQSAYLNLTSIKLKNCDQLLRTMAKLTGVDFKNEKVDTSYNELKGACPTADDLDSLSPSNISMAVKLSIEFCGGFADRIRSEKLVKDLDFSKNPQMALTDEVKTNLYKLFYNQLWNGDVRKDIPSYEELSASSDALLKDILKQGDIGNKENATQYIVQGLCTPVLSAAPVTTL